MKVTGMLNQRGLRLVGVVGVICYDAKARSVSLNFIEYIRKIISLLAR